LSVPSPTPNLWLLANFDIDQPYAKIKTENYKYFKGNRPNNHQAMEKFSFSTT
jgi:hypothetical protein